MIASGLFVLVSQGSTFGIADCSLCRRLPYLIEDATDRDKEEHDVDADA